MVSPSKNSTWSKSFYLTILRELNSTTNLSEISKKLNISKQKLNYYLRRLVKEGLVIHKSKGWYELNKSSKNSTYHGKRLVKDLIRGHGYVWTIKLPKEIEGWGKRLEIIKKKGINYKLVGAKENTPRIKVYGRKVWLCNDSIRIYDKKDMSYYGKNAIECRKIAFQEFYLIVGILERKLGIFFKPLKFSWNKEHYALIKNDLAIHENKQGNILRIKDETGEWLIVDDSLGKGGELENIGKKSFQTNIHMQKWWNEYKEINFGLTPKLITKNFNDVTNMIKQSSEIHLDSELRIKQMESNMRGMETLIYLLTDEVKRLKDSR